MSYVKPMKRIISLLIILTLVLSISTCLKPDSIKNSTAVVINLIDVIETTGYARDVEAHGDKIFVAASQAGNQIWQDNNGTVTKIMEHHFSAFPALRVTLEPESRILFAFDREKGFFKLLNEELTDFDSVYVTGDCIDIDENNGNYGSGSNEDFIARKLNDSLVALYVIDRTPSDGLKRYYFNRRFKEPIPFICEGGYYYWKLSNVGVSTGGINLGMDIRDSLIAISHDELGVGLYNSARIELDTLSIVDTPGEALEVKFYDNYLLSANNWAGMGIFSMGAGESGLTHLSDIEVSGWVKQISIWNDIAVLSCGENGIFLVDISDPENPKVDQPIEAGYTYRTYVAGDTIYAATREGVKRYHIESR
jgi:hypothetical protein